MLRYFWREFFLSNIIIGIIYSTFLKEKLWEILNILHSSSYSSFSVQSF